MNVGGGEVCVSFVDVTCETWQGEQSLATQPAGEAGRVGQGSVGLQAGNSLESSLTNLARSEQSRGEVRVEVETHLALQDREGRAAAAAVQQAGDGVVGLRVWI